ncbi:MULTISPECIES: Rossmann-like and DUF2520 domain-containing protein [Nocardiopsis]|jgi:predicted short-subunit dehydrogenase-like oxidoreductase (DUF2520 family)|uniref:Oxidoreductase n=1 Tax=Nocardiopsis sinuspersici TaxID=501010 RepID=A0A1V3C774_9ACTN|nr:MULTISPECIES: DUF2520 domain-containing protein [Nocardiopsis]NYH53248.1 putative short-subunit dehydrogenase-like oxidoreductase (DUF2520 family) [Nocardiopsis sinuspersici]OOC56601.1 oxidoreductase [Nocardiopsis sinuspersici]
METTQGRPARLRVGVIGPGRVGSVLGRALGRAGHKVVAASAVSESSKERVTDRLPTARVLEPAQVAEACDLVLLTVPDDALPDLVEGLASTGTDLRGKILVHTSGAHGYGVLAPATVAGALPLALHPAMTFTGRDEDVDRLANCAFGITAPEQLRPIAEALVVEMGAEPVWIPEDKRTLYHAALAGGANHLVTLVADSAALLVSAGVPEPGRVLAPMLSAALDNALRLGIHGLSGPVLRGDAGTVAGHIEQLRENAPESVASYVELARLTADRAINAGMLKPEDAARLLDVLRR